MLPLKSTNKLGFTLIEVLIALAILGTISIMVGQSVQQAVRTKAKIQNQVEDVSKLRDALRIIERDVNLAFHYRDIEKELKEIIKKKEQQKLTNNGQPQQPQAFPTPDPDLNNPDLAKRIDPATHFVGSNEAMTFTTMNTGRMNRNSKQADFMEVGYSLKDCPSLDGKKNSKCLFRRASNFVDEDVTKGGTETVLLENISEFSLKYIGKGKQDWNTDWRTDAAGDGVTKDNFPWAVEVSLKVEYKEKGNKKYSMTSVFPIHFPNNPDKDTTNSSSTNYNSSAGNTTSRTGGN